MIYYIRELITKDFWLKLFSLALAVLIWFTISFAIQKQVPVVGNPTTSFYQITFYNVPVVVLASASDVKEIQVVPKEVEVTVQGAAELLKQLKADEIQAMVDLTGVESAQDMRKRIKVSSPPGITHVRVVPQDVRIIFPKPIITNQTE